MDVKVFKNRELVATVSIENLISVCNYSNNRIAVTYKNNNTDDIIVCDVIYFK